MWMAEVKNQLFQNMVHYQIKGNEEYNNIQSNILPLLNPQPLSQ